MASLIFCCADIKPYRPQYLSHESKFTSFLSWAAFPRSSALSTDNKGEANLVDLAPFAVQLVRQKNYGSLESKKYFVPAKNSSDDFIEVAEDDLIRANFEKLNSYKNYKCKTHDKFFEVNIYQKDPVNKHHWRATLARPARDIDLSQRSERPQTDDPSILRLFETSVAAKSGAISNTKGASIKIETLGGTDAFTPPAEILHLHQALRVIFKPNTQNTLGKGKLLSLLAFDDLKSGLASIGKDLNLDLNPTWSQYLNAAEITELTMNCSEDTLQKATHAQRQAIQANLAIAFHDALQSNVDSHGGRDQLVRILRRTSQSTGVGDDCKCLIRSALGVVAGDEGNSASNQDDNSQGEHLASRMSEQEYREEEEEVLSRSPSFDFDRDSYDYEPEYRDFTACDKECGYCGKCDY